jgi:hypothetical protein
MYTDRKEYWNSIFEYKDGYLYWTDCKSSRALNGELAGGLMNNGYIRVDVGDRSYGAHRIIYEMHFGEISDATEIDHIDGDRGHNAIENLRLATHMQNMCNMKMHADNTSGFKGVSKKRNKWRARIMVAGKEIALGVFETASLAKEAYDAAAKELHGEFFRV